MRRNTAGKKQKRTRQRRRSVPARRRRQPKRAKSQIRIPRTMKQFFAMSEEAQDLWKKTTDVVSEMRRTGISLRQASRKSGINAKVVRGLVGKTLRKRPDGRYMARRTDRLLRVLVIPTRRGLREIATNDSRQASQIARYGIALNRYVTSGDASALRKFDRKKIKNVKGRRIPLLTDLAELDHLASAGELSFETIYAKR